MNLLAAVIGGAALTLFDGVGMLVRIGIWLMEGKGRGK